LLKKLATGFEQIPHNL